MKCDFTIAPTYAPLLLISKYHVNLGSRVFRLVRSGQNALLQFIDNIRPDWIVLSLADIKSAVPAIRQSAQDLLSHSSEAGINVLMDSGGLERHQMPAEYFQDPCCFDRPLTNLREHFSLSSVPAMVTLLDDLRLPSPLRALLEIDNELVHEIETGRIKNTKILLVIHESDLPTIPLLQASELLGVIDDIALAERELASASLQKIPMLLRRGLVVFGVDDLSLCGLRHCLQFGAYLGDSMAWLTRRLTSADWKVSTHHDHWKVWDDSWCGLPEERLTELLYENLLFLKETERRLVQETN